MRLCCLALLRTWKEIMCKNHRRRFSKYIENIVKLSKINQNTI
jgi:hypothetical protein